MDIRSHVVPSHSTHLFQLATHVVTHSHITSYDTLDVCVIDGMTCDRCDDGVDVGDTIVQEGGE